MWISGPINTEASIYGAQLVNQTEEIIMYNFGYENNAKSNDVIFGAIDAVMSPGKRYFSSFTANASNGQTTYQASNDPSQTYMTIYRMA